MKERAKKQKAELNEIKFIRAYILCTPQRIESVPIWLEVIVILVIFLIVIVRGWPSICGMVLIIQTLKSDRYKLWIEKYQLLVEVNFQILLLHRHCPWVPMKSSMKEWARFWIIWSFSERNSQSEKC